MNFLAHTYLSGSDPEILVGNFIGDFVKGKQIEKFEENIKPPKKGLTDPVPIDTRPFR